MPSATSLLAFFTPPGPLAFLPRREDFKPALNAIPSAPTLPPLRLPPFRAPLLEADVPFVEPEMLPLPEVPAQPQASQRQPAC